jgi:hypothetical protein
MASISTDKFSILIYTDEIIVERRTNENIQISEKLPGIMADVCRVGETTLYKDIVDSCYYIHDKKRRKIIL